MKPASIKYLRRFFVTVLLLFFFNLSAVLCQKKYEVQYFFQDKDTLEHFHRPELKSEFESTTVAETYINNLPQMLLKKGFAAGSVDSVFYDSTNAKVELYIGKQYKWARISRDSIAPYLLKNTGWKSLQKAEQYI